VRLDDTEVIGRTQEVVQAYLTELGLVLDARQGIAAPTDDQVGLAYSVNPKGNVRKGETITVNFYTEIPPPVASKPSAVQAPAGPWLSGDDITVIWLAYNGCPAGHPLSGFNFQITNGTAATNNPVSSGSTSLSIELGDPGTTTIAYTALCTDFESPVSDQTSVTVN
jgi:serine/threonine-protein kinase